MLFILIYAITGWKIKRGNRDPELWSVWKRTAWMETAVQILYAFHYDMRLTLKNEEITFGFICLFATMTILRYGALIMLYKAWKRFPVKTTKGD